MLSNAPVRTDPPVSPVAFMLSGAATFGVLHGIVGLQAPAMEVPGAVSLLEQAFSALGKNIEALLCVASAVIATVLVWSAALGCAGSTIPILIGGPRAGVGTGSERGETSQPAC